MRGLEACVAIVVSTVILGGLFAPGCSGGSGSDPIGADTIVKGTRVQLMPLRGGLVHPRPPATPAFSFYGGPVLPSVKVIEVAWRGNVQFAAQLGQFYGAIAQSEYFDLLAEYATGSQSIGRGSFEALVTDATAPAGTTSDDTIDDEAIQSELARLIHDGAVPANDASTLYAVHFPPGVTVTQAENTSCVDFCAYHGSFRRNGDLVAYAVIPDMGGACAQACGGADAFANTTWVASHELVQAVTDPAIGFAPADPGAPLAWYDPMYGEIPDACDGTAQIGGFVVQTQWSARDGKCRFGSSSTGSFVVGVSPSAQTVKAGTSATMVVTTAATGPTSATIALAVDGLPEGVTATFSPASVAPGKSATITLVAAGLAPSAAVDVIISGTSQAETQSTTARLTVEGAKPPNLFTMTATPVTQTVELGDSVTFTVSTTPVSGTAESIVLGAAGLPAGVAATFSPPSLLAGGSAIMTVGASSQAQVGSALVTITGTARSHTQSETISLDVASAPAANDFSVAVAPAAATVIAGHTGSYTVTTALVSGSAQPIVLTASGLPGGVTGTFAPPSVTAGGSAVLTVAVAPGAATISDAPFAITAAASSGTHSTHAAITVTAAPPTDDFNVTVTPTSRSLPAGTATSFTVTTAVVSGGPVPVAFAISGLPAGVTAVFTPTATIAGGSVTLTIDASPTAVLGSAALSVTGAATGGSHAATATITVTAPPPPDFAIGIAPPSQTMSAGLSTAYAITTQIIDGPALPVALAVTGLPVGVRGTFDPVSVTAGQSSTLTLHADAGTTAPSTAFTVTGTATGGASHSATAAVAVTLPTTNTFSLGLAPGSATVPAGATTSFTVSTAVVSGAAQSIALTVTGLPAGTSGAVQPATITAGQSATLTLTVGASAAPGSTTFSVTGSAPSGTHTALADLTVTPSPLGNLIDNGDFEDGSLDGWTVTRGNVTNVSINPHGGARSMKVGRSSGVDSRSVVSQDLDVPATGPTTGKTTLSFWMYPRCEDEIDIHYVSIVVNGVFDDLIASCSNASVFIQKSFDISRYAGQTVTLLFEADVDFFAIGSAWFYIDDVVVTTQP